jgi:glycosyltransferase involved in cell wall biosynthesis
MRVALIGNVAQNAFLLAQALRRLDRPAGQGIEADSFDLGGGTAMWVPYWELADFDVETGGIYPDHYDWLTPARQWEVARPPWAKILGADGAEPWYDTQEAFQADLARFYGAARFITLPGEHRQVRDAHVRTLLARSRLDAGEQEQAVADLQDYPAVRSILTLAANYDLTVLLGPMAAYGVLFPPDVPYVTFEHSTMRHAPSKNTPEHRLIALAYRHADANVLTNADCAEAAWALGLHEGGADRRLFIPHPVDTDRFAPCVSAGDVAAAQQLRRQMLEPGGDATRDAEVIFWQPARQAAPGVAGGKRNDRVLHAFRRYVDEAEPQGAPKAVLILSYWGLETRDTADLMERLGFKHGGRFLWAACSSKPRMRRLYHAADVILDQFDWSVGSFGTTTVEALSCGRPVITHLDPQVHRWCLDSGGLGELPPIVQARTADELYRQMVLLATYPQMRADYGHNGRAWVEEFHSWRLVAERHAALYRRVLGRCAAAAQPAAEPTEPEPVGVAA